MRGITDTFHRWCGIFAVMVIGLVSQAGCADAQRPAKTVFSVSDDQTLSYPPSIRYLPDEHTTVLPLTELEIPEHPTFVAPQELSRNLFFVSMSNVIRNVQYDGAFVLESSNFSDFDFAPGFGVPAQGRAVFWAPHPSANCGYETVTHFDEQYAGPGSVVEDPSLPRGNLIMI